MFLGVSWVAEQKQLPWAEFGSSALALSSRDTAPFGPGLQPSNTLFRRLRNQGLRCFFPANDAARIEDLHQRLAIASWTVCLPRPFL
jgi:hypothetical protein